MLNVYVFVMSICFIFRISVHIIIMSYIILLYTLGRNEFEKWAILPCGVGH